MPKKSNVEIAFDAQVKNLDDAQAEMVKVEFKTWLWNKRRISDIEGALDAGNLSAKERNDLVAERHKLITENTSLYSHINRALKGTAVIEDDLGDFCFGK